MYTSSDTELSFFLGNLFIPLTSVLNRRQNMQWQLARDVRVQNGTYTNAYALCTSRILGNMVLSETKFDVFIVHCISKITSTVHLYNSRTILYCTLELTQD